MKNTILLVSFLGLVALGLGLWLLLRNQGRLETQESHLRIGETELTVELADTPEKRLQGLSGREPIADDWGMLFVFPDSGRRSFWMREMRFPLDMVFIDQRQVVEIIPDVPAPAVGQDGREIRVVSKEAAEWVLEVNAGWVERQGIEVGDPVELLERGR